MLRDFGYFGILCLMIIAIVGVVYRAVVEDGWIDQFLGNVLDRSVGTVLMVLVGLVAGGWFIRRWLIASRRNALFNDLLMYGMVAIGVLFLVRWLVHGTL